MSLSVVAAGRYCETATEELPNLKPLVAENVGQNVRRIDRFIQLALIGAGRAAAGMPASGGVYYASGRGDVHVGVELLESIYRDRQPPMPLTFVNSVSNAASFYVSKCLGLRGPSSFVTSRFFALESALHIAALEIEQGRVDSALVGAVDVVLPPLAEHRQRLGLAPETPVAEASHWLQLCAEPKGRPVLAELESLQHFSDLDGLLAALLAHDSRRLASIAFNQFIGSEAKTRCLSQSRLPQFESGNQSGHFDSRSGESIDAFVDSGHGSLLLVSADPHGRYRLTCFKRIVSEAPTSGPPGPRSG